MGNRNITIVFTIIFIYQLKANLNVGRCLHRYVVLYKTPWIRTKRKKKRIFKCQKEDKYHALTKTIRQVHTSAFPMLVERILDLSGSIRC
jgi:hypothetical protein